MEAIYSSETPLYFYLTLRRYMSEDRNLHYHFCGNLKYNKKWQFVQTFL
jgi:hypothetical protein